MAAGFPGTFQGGYTVSSLSIGAVQPGSGGVAFPGTFQGGYSVSHLNIGAVKLSSSVPTNIVGSATMSLTASGALTSNAMTGSATLTLIASGAILGLGVITGTTTINLTVSGPITALGTIFGSTTITLAASGALTGEGNVTGATTLTLTTSGPLTGLGLITGSTTLTLTVDGSLTSNALEGTISISLTATGDLTYSVAPTPSLDPCDRYRCEGDVENQGSAIVAAGYRLATAGSNETEDRAAPAIANTGYRLKKSVVESCKRIRKN